MTPTKWMLEKVRTCSRCGTSFTVASIPSGRKMCRPCQHARQAHGMSRAQAEPLVPVSKVEVFMDAVVANELKPPWERDTVDNLRRRLLA